MTGKNQNLLVRILTVLVLLPLVLWLIWHGGVAFALLLSVAAAGCAFELNMLPQTLPPAASEIEEIEQEGALASGATIVSIAGAFMIPLLEEVPLGVVTSALVLTIVVIIAFADAL